jgi:hypothetical protein
MSEHVPVHPGCGLMKYGVLADARVPPCLDCAVEKFEFVYWDTPERKSERDKRTAELLRRVAETLD